MNEYGANLKLTVDVSPAMEEVKRLKEEIDEAKASLLELATMVKAARTEIEGLKKQ